jgi:hypothetical protein
MLMGAHDGAVDEDVFEVGIIAQRLEKILPNTATLKAKALGDSS